MQNCDPSDGGSDRERWRRAGRRAVVAVLAVLATISGSLIGSEAVANAPSTDQRDCPRLIFYYSRGSGQRLGPDSAGLGSPGLQLYAALSSRFGASNVASVVNAYPASPVSSVLTGSYMRSAMAGVSSEVRNVTDFVHVCPSSQLLLAGFSQGAQVTRVALSRLSASDQSRVAAVILFGDPYFSAVEPGVKVFGEPKTGQVGILRQVRPKTTPLIPTVLVDKVFTWCHPYDSVCQGAHLGNGAASHSTYGGDTVAASAAIAPLVAAHAGMTYSISGTCLEQLCAVATYSGPGSTSFKTLGAVHERQTVSITCQVKGETVTGANGIASAIWDRLSGGGFVSDYYVNTPLVDKFSPGLNRCTDLSVGSL
jgi:Cutinase